MSRRRKPGASRARAWCRFYQSFGGGSWSDGDGGEYRLPTAAQLRTMLARWRALIPAPLFDFAYSWGVQTGRSCARGYARFAGRFSRTITRIDDAHLCTRAPDIQRESNPSPPSAGLPRRGADRTSKAPTRRLHEGRFQWPLGGLGSGGRFDSQKGQWARTRPRPRQTKTAIATFQTIRAAVVCDRRAGQPHAADQKPTERAIQNRAGDQQDCGDAFVPGQSSSETYCGPRTSRHDLTYQEVLRIAGAARVEVRTEP